MDNSCMENFFGRLKTEMFYGETFQSTDEFIRTLEEYIWYYNNERNSIKVILGKSIDSNEEVCYTYDEKDLEFAKWHFMTAFLFGPFSYLFAI